jgi:hypothetical protein
MRPLFRLHKLTWLLIPLIALEVACNKQKFLDKKPTTAILVPSTLSDFQALLDNVKVFGLVPTLGEASSDNYYITYNAWLAMTKREKNAYVWATDIYGGEGAQQDWNTPYQQVFYANVVLDGLKGLQMAADSADKWNSIKGAALFLRAFAFYNLAQVFAPMYDSVTARSDLGIPLRTSSSIDTLSARSSVLATYSQILNDLYEAESRLPDGTPGYALNRPVKVCAQALLARVYLSMRNYPMARATADSALKIDSQLIDYNDLPLSGTFIPIITANPETLFQASFLGPPTSIAYYSAISTNYPTTWIDTGLLRTYDTSDLRLAVFYRTKNNDTTFSLRGNYTGTLYPFGGLAIDELMLISAESAARAGDATAAMREINILLNKRWRKGKFNGYPVTTADAARDTVLLERRKELAFRGLRWTDLRRLNKEGANITLSRILVDTSNGQNNSQKFTLAPNSLNYTLPIPPDVISLNAAIQQNSRN